MEPVLVSHLAERQLESDSVADSSLVDTVALLGWISTNIDNTDQHALATQVFNCQYRGGLFSAYEEGFSPGLVEIECSSLVSRV